MPGEDGGGVRRGLGVQSMGNGEIRHGKGGCKARRGENSVQTVKDNRPFGAGKSGTEGAAEKSIRSGAQDSHDGGERYANMPCRAQGGVWGVRRSCARGLQEHRARIQAALQREARTAVVWRLALGRRRQKTLRD